MSTLTFYAKPGCVTNARQRRLLEEAGHEVQVRDLLSEPWTRERLLAFFAGLPVAQWINRSAPRVKSGEIDPGTLTQERALTLLLAEPLLIRRPLLEIGDVRLVGFEPQRLREYLHFPEDVPASAQVCSQDGTPV